MKNDKVKEFVDLLMGEGKIGGKVPLAKKLIILQEGKVRFENMIPPGYEDSKKDGVHKYGDLFVWKDIIEIAQEKNANILFVCNDIKEDWWEEDRKNQVELRKELLEEFKEYNPLLEIHFLTLEKFFSYIAEELKIGQSKSALQLSALEYAEKNLKQHEEMIESEIGNFFASINADDIIGVEVLSCAGDEQIYWSIRDVAVDKEERIIIYYVDLDISILADLIQEENAELVQDMGKLAIALNGKIKLTTEEYSRGNNLEDIDVDIMEIHRIRPEIWRLIKRTKEGASCREIIDTCKRLTLWSEAAVNLEDINKLGQVLQKYAEAYRHIINPLPNVEGLAEAFEPLRTFGEEINAFNVANNLKEALQPLADAIGCSKAKVNMVLNELIDNGYAQIYKNTKGRYVLTKDAKEILKKLEC